MISSRYTYLAMTPQTRARVTQISLLGLAQTSNWEISVSGWLGLRPAAARPIAPALARLPMDRLQCFLGEDEDDSGCRLLDGARAEVIETKGGHHFDGDYAAIAAKIVTGLDRRATVPPSARSAVSGSGTPR